LTGLLESYFEELERYNKHLRGEYEGTSLAGDYWREVIRKNTVRLGNAYKRRTGVAPPHLDSVINRPRRWKGLAD